MIGKLLVTFFVAALLVPDIALSQDKTPTPIQTIKRNQDTHLKEKSAVKEQPNPNNNQVVIVLNKTVPPIEEKKETCTDQFNTFTGIIRFQVRVGWKLFFDKPICFQQLDEKYYFDHFYMIDYTQELTNYFLANENKDIKIILYNFSIEPVYYQTEKTLFAIRFKIIQ